MSRQILLRFACGVAALCLLFTTYPASADDNATEKLRKLTECEFAKTLTVDVGHGVQMEFVLIPPGKFMMGSPPEEKGRRGDEAQHAVTITRPFYMAKYPMTQEQYEAITGDNRSCFSAAAGSQERRKRIGHEAISGRRRLLGGRQGLLRANAKKRRAEVPFPTTDGGRMGIRLPRGDNDAIPFRLNSKRTSGDLQWELSIWCSQEGALSGKDYESR